MALGNPPHQLGSLNGLWTDLFWRDRPQAADRTRSSPQPKITLTIVRNIENIMAWMENGFPNCLRHMHHGTIWFEMESHSGQGTPCRAVLGAHSSTIDWLDRRHQPLCYAGQPEMGSAVESGADAMIQRDDPGCHARWPGISCPKKLLGVTPIRCHPPFTVL